VLWCFMVFHGVSWLVVSESQLPSFFSHSEKIQHNTTISPLKLNILRQNSSCLTYPLYYGPLDAQLTLDSCEPVYNSSSKTAPFQPPGSTE